MIIHRIAISTGLNPNYLQKLVKTASHRYKIYYVQKRTGGMREIAHPATELKLLQRWLVDNIFSCLPIHDSVYSYRKGIGIRELAKQHYKNKYLLRIDFTNFFPSIKGNDIQKLIKRNANLMPFPLSRDDFSIIRSVVCKDDHLPIGAPSSPVITNAILFDFDSICYLKAKSHGVKYTRYADDIYFSTNQSHELESIYKEFINDLKSLNNPKLKINEHKTVFSSKKNKRIVTGLILTSDNKISIGRAKKRYIKSMVHHFILGDLSEKDLSYLRGYLAYIKSVEPSFLIHLGSKFDKKTIIDIFKTEIVSRKE